MFEFEHNAAVDPAALADLFARAGWREREPRNKLEWAMAGSAGWVTCRVEGELVGFGRIHKVDAVHTLVFDVVVDEQFQGIGLDDEIIRRLTERSSSLERIAVFRHEDVETPRSGADSRFGYWAPDAPPDAYLGQTTCGNRRDLASHNHVHPRGRDRS